MRELRRDVLETKPMNRHQAPFRDALEPRVVAKLPRPPPSLVLIQPLWRRRLQPAGPFSLTMALPKVQHLPHNNSFSFCWVVGKFFLRRIILPFVSFFSLLYSCPSRNLPVLYIRKRQNKTFFFHQPTTRNHLREEYEDISRIQSPDPLGTLFCLLCEHSILELYFLLTVVALDRAQMW